MGMKFILQRSVYMTILTKWIILIILLVAAIISYSYGFSQGIILLIGLGFILESAFWLGVFSKNKKDPL